ncbi:D-tagatose 3-epimerase [Schizosaccharomyces octosporus yFS286]|uniref:D-tagatose 3-epimerase n=1 Tax=Schizosaccharomyces octosporus (strain yFS286) TaxID=483514 RepID=S9PSC9_SCHOY|nr:D-tagatose 3-epimerase [Schizosaccharomyces octosporus yFS286]EPX70418.1 D-tagatose 3-epimerase [Schizosaccharomyces octosporus yFS286]
MHLSTHTWMRPEPLETTLKRASELGYESIELAGIPEQYPIEETKKLLEKYRLKCWGTVTLQMGDHDLAASKPEQRKMTVQYIKDVIDMAAGLGGKITSLVPVTVGKLAPTSTPENEWNWVVEGLKEVHKHALSRGIKVGLEPLNRFETYFLNRIDQALALADAVGPEMGIALDPFHLNIEEANMFSAIKSAGKRIYDVHVSDNNRLPIGDGSMDWKRIYELLKEIGYDGGLAVEFMPNIDRTPVNHTQQLETKEVDIPPALRKFIEDHASSILNDEYFTSLMKTSADNLRSLLGKSS